MNRFRSNLFYILRDIRRDADPLFFSSKVEEWVIMTFVIENYLLDKFVVFGFRFGTNLN